MRSALAILFIACLLGCVQLDNSSRLDKLKEFVQVVNSQSQDGMEAFIRTRFSSRLVQRLGVADWAKRFLGLGQVGVPMTVGQVLKEDTKSLIVAIKGASGDGWEMRMTFDEEVPHGVTSVVLGPPGSQTAPAPKHYTDWKTIRELLEEVRGDTKVPALSIGFISGNTTEVEVAGVRELGKPASVAATDRWLIGSVTKSMTSMMIARLVDRGVLRWNLTLGEALPKTPMRQSYREVTLLELLQHRAGVQQDRTVTAASLAQSAGKYQNAVEARENYTRFTLNREPIARPGEKMAYSNAGYAIAAHVAEVAAGRPYEELMRELVFEPLGMTSAQMGVPGTSGNPGGPGQIQGYVLGDHGLEAHVLNEPKLTAIDDAAGAGVSMSIADLLRFARYNLEGLRGHVTLMSQANFQVLHTPADQTPGASKYACGWVIDEKTAKRPFHGHNGSDGTFYAEVAIWPEQDFAAVAICNAGNGGAPSPPMQAILAAYERYAR